MFNPALSWAKGAVDCPKFTKFTVKTNYINDHRLPKKTKNLRAQAIVEPSTSKEHIGTMTDNVKGKSEKNFGVWRIECKQSGMFASSQKKCGDSIQDLA
jgi:hypothetical protein